MKVSGMGISIGSNKLQMYLPISRGISYVSLLLIIGSLSFLKKII